MSKPVAILVQPALRPVDELEKLKRFTYVAPPPDVIGIGCEKEAALAIQIVPHGYSGASARPVLAREPWMKLGLLPESELANYDVAIVSLLCALGLPGMDIAYIHRCLQRLDEMAECVRWQTVKNFTQFHRKPERYHRSAAYFRALMLVTVLQRDFGLHYNPEKIPDDAAFDTADTFIHGALFGDGGTCATIPVVYAAVGRRLSYPLKLVSTHGKQFGHLFVRWEQPRGARFNMEATAQGLNCPSDDYYRKSELYDVTSEEERESCFLKSKTPREELAHFAMQRGYRWQEIEKHRLATEAFAWASALAPNNRSYWNVLHHTFEGWRKKIIEARPANFPPFTVSSPFRRFPQGLPQQVEDRICGADAMERLLNNPDLERRLWAPQRRGEPLPIVPKKATLTYAPSGESVLNITYFESRPSFNNGPKGESHV